MAPLRGTSIVNNTQLTTRGEAYPREALAIVAIAFEVLRRCQKTHYRSTIFTSGPLVGRRLLQFMPSA
jgi:hypothetical protein